jgi:hypothetical protein
LVKSRAISRDKYEKKSKECSFPDDGDRDGICYKKLSFIISSCNVRAWKDFLFGTMKFIKLEVRSGPADAPFYITVLMAV